MEGYSFDHALPSIIEEEEGLGAHTSVLTLSPSSGKRYSWYHQQIKPMGLNIALQCTKCGRLRSSNIVMHDEFIRVSCLSDLCNHSFDIPRSVWRLSKRKIKGKSGWGVEEFW